MRLLLLLFAIGLSGCANSAFLNGLKKGTFDFSVMDLVITFAIYFVATRVYRKFKGEKEGQDDSTPRE